LAKEEDEKRDFDRFGKLYLDFRIICKVPKYLFWFYLKLVKSPCVATR
jgi:hypothetical protein